MMRYNRLNGLTFFAFQTGFHRVSQSVTNSCFLCSPFITYKPIVSFVDSVTQRGLQKSIQVEVLTDLSTRHLIDGVTDVAALCYLQESIANVRITYLPRLHAKVYIADDSLAIIASANYTDGGATANFEYGVRTRKPAEVNRVRRDMRVYANLGSEVSPSKLHDLRDRIDPLRELVRDEKRNINLVLREASKELREFTQRDSIIHQTEDDLIRIRVEKRSINAIFTDTILYLLADGPLSTADLHKQIQQIHIDLCDDAIDRVIDGVHYGKKWKHQVRNAQVGLRRAGHIFLDAETGLWQLDSETKKQ
jgi:hypothetical protein